MNPLQNPTFDEQQRDYRPKGHGLIVAGNVLDVSAHLAATFAAVGSGIELLAGPSFSAFLPDRPGAEQSSEFRVRTRVGVLRFGALIEVLPWAEHRAELTVRNDSSGFAAASERAAQRLWSAITEACRLPETSAISADTDLVGSRRLPDVGASKEVKARRHLAGRSTRRTSRTPAAKVH